MALVCQLSFHVLPITWPCCALHRGHASLLVCVCVCCSKCHWLKAAQWVEWGMNYCDVTEQ